MIINCVAYQDGRKMADIHPSDISASVNRPECFVWVALHAPDAEELAAMQEEFTLHPLGVEDARHGHQRPKLEEYGDSLFVVLHLLNIEQADVHVGEVAVFVGPNYVLSVRRWWTATASTASARRVGSDASAPLHPRSSPG